MYTREQASQARQAFWTTFGQYMQPVPNAEGTKVNWINYKTGIRYVAFKMDADKRTATVSIVLSHPDIAQRSRFYSQFLSLQSQLHTTLNEEWCWQDQQTDEYGKSFSIIFTQLAPINIFNKAEWPALISFFKQRITALDQFWSDTRPWFEALG